MEFIEFATSLTNLAIALVPAMAAMIAFLKKSNATY